jgi:hypothetical protein
MNVPGRLIRSRNTQLIILRFQELMGRILNYKKCKISKSFEMTWGCNSGRGCFDLHPTNLSFRCKFWCFLERICVWSGKCVGLGHIEVEEWRIPRKTLTGKWWNISTLLHICSWWLYDAAFVTGPYASEYRLFIFSVQAQYIPVAC